MIKFNTNKNKQVIHIYEERKREAETEKEKGRKRKGYNLRHFSLLVCIRVLWLFVKNEITLYKLFCNLLLSLNIYLSDLSTSAEINLPHLLIVA